MAENEQVTEQRSERVKTARLHYTLVCLGGVALDCAAFYLDRMRRYGTGVFSINEQLNIEALNAAPRPWAQRVGLPGVPNFHKVSDDLYRGAQPSAKGMRQLKKLGIKTIVNLRSFHSDRQEIGNTGLAYEHIYMKTWHPEDKEVVRFLQIVTDKSRTPVFVHCRRGADRTGTMCAIYRVAVQGWSKAEAVEEMTKGGFKFYSGWQNLIRYIIKIDIDEIKGRAGLQK